MWEGLCANFAPVIENSLSEIVDIAHGFTADVTAALADAPTRLVAFVLGRTAALSLEWRMPSSSVLLMLLHRMNYV